MIGTDPYATAPVDTDKFGANWTSLETLASQLRGDRIARGTNVVRRIQISLKSQLHLKTVLPRRLSSDGPTNLRRNRPAHRMRLKAKVGAWFVVLQHGPRAAVSSAAHSVVVG